MIFSSHDTAPGSSREKSHKHGESNDLDFKATLRDVQSLGMPNSVRYVEKLYLSLSRTYTLLSSLTHSFLPEQHSLLLLEKTKENLSKNR